jgi:hypothetical protein
VANARLALSDKAAKIVYWWTCSATIYLETPHGEARMGNKARMPGMRRKSFTTSRRETPLLVLLAGQVLTRNCFFGPRRSRIAEIEEEEVDR